VEIVDFSHPRESLPAHRPSLYSRSLVGDRINLFGDTGKRLISVVAGWHLVVVVVIVVVVIVVVVIVVVPIAQQASVVLGCALYGRAQGPEEMKQVGLF